MQHTSFEKLLKTKTTILMGILNVTPDSFSDGGLFVTVESAIQRVQEMIEQGADIIDIGGESTRPGAAKVNTNEEMQRVMPVIQAVKKTFGDTILLSVDTYKAEVAERALEAGVTLVNSLGGFLFEPLLAKVVATFQCPIMIYHIHGKPETMQQGEIVYKNVVNTIKDFFHEQMNFGLSQGVKKEQFLLDPGIGFGKTVDQNIEIIKRIGEFGDFKLPIAVGVSRKSHLGKLLQQQLQSPNLPDAHERLEAALAETAYSVLSGVRIIRTHNVQETKKFLITLDYIKNYA